MSTKSLVPANALASASAPTTPTLKQGDLYYNTANSTLYVYSGTAWAAVSGGGGSGAFTFSTTAPTSPAAGDRWIDSNSGIEYTYVNDGDSSQWIVPASTVTINAWKNDVVAATTASITLSGAQTIDGVAVVAGNRVLVKNQATASQNGIYEVSATTWTRAVDADSAAELASAVVNVISGTVNGGSTWTTTFKSTDTLGTTAVNFYSIPTSANNLSFFAATTSAQLAGVISDETGSGALVFATSPTLVTPNLGTPSALTLTNATGLPIAGITGLGTGVGTFLATPSSANLASAVTDETGSGALVFGTSPSLTTPTIAGATISGTFTSTATISGGTVNATTLQQGGTGVALITGAAFTGAVSTTSTLTATSTVSASGLAGSLLSGATPQALGTAAAGNSAVPARDNHVHPTTGLLTTDGSWKASVRVATTGTSYTLAGGAPSTLDGQTLALNDRILVKDQATASQNGIYYVTTVGAGTTGTWTRATDADTAAKIAGSAVAVLAGTTNGGGIYYTGFKSTDTLGTTSMTWTKISASAGGGGSGAFTYSATPPAVATATAGDRWIDSDTGIEYTLIDDGVGSPSKQWVAPTIPGYVGPQGLAATIAVGTVTTGSPGTSVTVANSGTSGSAVFDFTIPRGDTGATGESMITFSRSGTVSTTTGTSRYRFPFAATLLGVSAAVNTASSSGAVSFAVKRNGTSLGTYSINAAANDLAESTLSTAISVGDYITVDITAAGTNASDLNVFVRYTR